MRAMKEKEFKIPEIESGIPDIEFIKKMNTDQFLNWIRARLSGADPYYPLNEYRGESRLAVFIWIFENTASDAFRNNFHLALRDLLIEATETAWDEQTRLKQSFLHNLIDLIGHFYAIYNQAESSRRKSGVHNRVEEILTGLCDPDGPLVENKDTYLRALYALSEVEGAPALEWEEIFRMKGGVFAAAAFGAIAKKNPIRAAELLPDFILSAENNPKDVSIDEEIFTLFDSHEHNPKMINEIYDTISKVFQARPREWGVFVKEVTDLGFDATKIKPISNIELNRNAIQRLSTILGIGAQGINLIESIVTQQADEMYSTRRRFRAIQRSPSPQEESPYVNEDIHRCLSSREFGGRSEVEKSITPYQHAYQQVYQRATEYNLKKCH